MHKDSNTELNTCPSCKTKFEGKFCYNCGEKAFHESDYKLKKFVTQTVEIFTHFDGKFIRSIKDIFIRPGFLTAENMHGIRVKYAKPMQIFLLANVFFFLITHWTGVTDYTPNIGDEKFGGISNFTVFKWLEFVDKWVIAKIEVLTDIKFNHFNQSQQEFSERFWLNSYVYSKSFIIMIIPFTAIVVYAFFRKKFNYFSNALTFSAHFVSFQLIVFSIISIFTIRYKIYIFKPVDWLFYETKFSPITNFFFGSSFELTTLIYWLPYLFVAFRRLFPEEHFLITLVKTYFIGRLLYFTTYIFYKKILIVLTLLLMH